MSKVFLASLSLFLFSSLLYGKQEAVVAKNLELTQQSEVRRVTGKITDALGEGLPGVSVFVSGTNLGTTTDIDGKFSIEIPKNTKLLEVSYIGMKDGKIALNTATDYNFIMQDAAVGLDEVVVVAYGSNKKEDLTTSVSSIKLDEDIKSRPASIESMLQGKLPGVTIQTGGGDPFRDETTISIRGRGSRGKDGKPASGDGVLFVVDGVPGAPYNVEDVESITVLKDAASSAMYGAYAGSGGVIVITTKKAKAGMLNLSVNSSLGFQRVQNLPEVISAEDFIRIKNDEYALNPEKQKKSIFLTDDYPYFGVTRTNWFDEIFRVAKVQHHAISLSGGAEKLTALASLSYDKQEGTLLNTYKEIIGAKMNVSFQPTNWLTLRENATYKYVNGQGQINNHDHEGVLMSALFFPRSSVIYDYTEKGVMMKDKYGNPLYQGTIPRYLAEKGVTGFGEIRNPVATLQRLNEYRPSHTIYSTTTMELKPIEHFLVKSDFTVGVSSDRYENFSPKVLEIGRKKDENSRTIGTSLRKNWIWETVASYVNTFDKHHVDALIGHSMSAENYRENGLTVFGFNRENKHYTIIPDGKKWKQKQPDEDIWDESAMSIFSRLGYSYDNRYFLTASIRRDATSKLYKDNNAGIFRALSGSWKVSSEDFFETLRPTVNLFKLRASWGEIGNKALVPRYSYNAALGSSDWDTFFGVNLDNATKGTFQKTISNKDLKWETTEQLGLGLDIQLFHSLDLTVDYFDKKTKDLIERLPIATSAGVSVAPYGNIGDVSNRGWEFSANYTKQLGDFTLNVYGNLNTVKNEVKNLGAFDFMSHTVSQQAVLRSEKGQPWYSFYLLKTAGIFQSKAEVDSYLHVNEETGETKKIQPKAQAGDLKFVDSNNDGVIDDKDRKFMGSYLPKLTYAFGAGLKFKGLDFALYFQGVSDVKIYNQFRAFGLTGRGESYMLKEVLNSWNYKKDSGIPKMGTLSDKNGNYGSHSDFFLEDGSFLRIKNLTLGYTLPSTVMNSLHLSGAKLRFYLNVENLATFTDYSGIDPEVGNFGVDVGHYPIARTISLGLNFNY